MSDQVSLRLKRLSSILKLATNTIHIDDAVRALNVTREHAAKLLAGWHKQGILRRVAHGLYVPVQPTALAQTQVLDDPWILVPDLYEPGYIGGWSALEYWGLTEQLFRSICVLTHKRKTYGNVMYQGVSFFIKYIPEKKLLGTRIVWRGNVKVKISDPHKTILDCIDDINLGAGWQHTKDSLSEFFKEYNQQSDYDLLLEYAIQINNGALFKKLGFLAEQLEINSSFIDECFKRLTEGYAYLDSDAQTNKLITKWKLWVPTGEISD